MSFRELLDTWKRDPKPAETNEYYSIRLSIDDAARLRALVALFPGTDEEQIVTDLLSTAVSQVEAAMPYEPGTKVIREDDHGDPIYEDIGMTPRFLELVREQQKALVDK